MENYNYEKMSREGYSCECEAAGYCPLLDKEMTPHLHSLCQTSEIYRNRLLENSKKRGVHNSSIRKMYRKDVAETSQMNKSADSAISELKKQGIEIDNISEGLGDTIEKVLNKFGITQEKIEKITGAKGCGCSERKKWFNKIFSYNKVDTDE